MSVVVRSTCGLCYSGCGVLVHLTDGKATEVEGDPDSPVNKGTLCAKGLASLEYLYHSERLKHPLRRMGERGKGRWQRISWDEALNVVAGELIEARDKYGAESVAFVQGAAKGLQDSYGERLVNAFGTPNLSTTGHVCFAPRAFASKITCGFNPIPDYEYPPACIVVWGANMAATRIGEHEQTIQALDKGTRLIVIDPRPTELAARAHTWLQLRPGSDLTLALGMINVIINEGLFDKAFVDNWTVGFDKLKAHIQDYSPERVEGITWLSAETIRKAARFYATNKPACIQWGNAIDQGVNSFQTARAVSILRAITDNLGVPGGESQWSSLGLLEWTSPELVLWNEMPADKWERRVGADHKLVPLFHRVLPQSIVKAVLQGDPYPIRVIFIQGANPLVTYSNAQQTYRALSELDFLVVVDMFMTPTAALADIVLPTASYLEFDNIVAPPYYPIAQVQQKVAEIGECRSDYEIINGLAKKMGLENYFWNDTEAFLDAILKPVGLTFSEFRRIGIISGKKQYRSYEVNGFETASGKVELYSSQLKGWGFDPLPIYREPPETPHSDPELAKEYPLIFITWKSEPYRHTGGKQIASLRDSHPEPIVTIHPETAGRLGIEEGDWVCIETKRGRIKQRATLSTGIAPRVVGADYAWWFPEEGISSLYGWAESNINILTDDEPPFNREMGSTNLRGVLCKVYKA
jgi:anaerobic selenocysteine-containing dehydrogenase